MAPKKLILILIVAPLLFSFFIGLAVAERDDDYFFECNHFDEDKEEDCEYILDLDMNEDDKLTILKTLYYEDYPYSSWEPENYEIDTDLLMATEEVGYDRIFLAWKIFIFGLMNYSIFSVLTKYSIIAKWLSVA